MPAAGNRLAFGRAGDRAPLVKWQDDYRLDDGRIVDSLGACLSPEVADLVDMAVAVYVTDRLCRRRPRHARDDGSHWSRNLGFSIALRDAGLWRRPAVMELLHALLAWLTDDEWEIEIADGGPEATRRSASQPTLFEAPLAQPATAGLLSGGLDSLLGAAAELDADGELLLISTKTSAKLGHHQRTLADGLGRLGARTVRHVSIPVNLTSEGKRLADHGEEPSQRTRAFVFLLLGAATAITGGCHQLRVYENGPGALNLALSAGQIGAMNTRATRPETLEMAGRLVSEVIGRSFVISNPNMWRTKAEMVTGAREGLDDMIVAARSCDTAYSARRARNAPCGACTSCVLRRQALLAGGRADLDQFDLEMMPGDFFAATPGHVSPPLRLMLQHVHALERCLAQDEPWRALVNHWPDLASARRALRTEPDSLIQLLRRYAAEWRTLSLPVVERVLTG